VQDSVPNSHYLCIAATISAFVANLYCMHNQKSLGDSYSLTALIGHLLFGIVEAPDIRRIPPLLDFFAM
jgi:hypothetical protein